MPVAVDAVTSGTSSGSPTVSHTCSGSDRVLYVLIAERYDTALTGVTYNGVALTSIHQANNGNLSTTNVWRLIAPASGANNVVISQSASHDLAYTILSVTGADQSTPEGTLVSGTANSTSPSKTAVAVADDLIVDLLSWWRGASQNATVGAGQTSRSNQTLGSLGGAVSTEPGGASIVMSWTMSASAYWNHVAIPVKQVAAGGGGPVNMLLVGAG